MRATVNDIKTDAQELIDRLKTKAKFSGAMNSVPMKLADDLFAKVCAMSALHDFEIATLKRNMVNTALRAATNSCHEYGDDVCNYVAELLNNSADANPEKIVREHLGFYLGDDQQSETDDFRIAAEKVAADLLPILEQDGVEELISDIAASFEFLKEGVEV